MSCHNSYDISVYENIETPNNIAKSNCAQSIVHQLKDTATSEETQEMVDQLLYEKGKVQIRVGFLAISCVALVYLIYRTND